MALLLGIFVAKLLGIAGIGGFIVGFFTRHWPKAAGMGVALGIADTLVVVSVRETELPPISWIMAIFVAVLTATIGWWLRGRKRA